MSLIDKHINWIIARWDIIYVPMSYVLLLSKGEEKMEDCLFCKIIKGEIPCKKVYEDEDVLAFYDIHPAAPIHILVIPKKHITSLAYLEKEDEAIVGKIYGIMNEIADDKGFKQDGYRVIVNCGKNGGQEVMHLHFHLLAGKQFGEKII